MRYPLLIPTIAHGSTDLIDKPVITIFSHIISFLFVNRLNYIQRKCLLILSSILHISRDLNFINNYNYIITLLLSCVLHYVWLQKPIISRLYLSLYHTPLHYIRNYNYSNKIQKIQKIFLVICSYYFIIYGLNNNIDIILENKYGKLWWVAPIIAHIYINEYILYNFTTKIIHNRILQKFIINKKHYYIL